MTGDEERRLLRQIRFLYDKAKKDHNASEELDLIWRLAKPLITRAAITINIPNGPDRAPSNFVQAFSAATCWIDKQVGRLELSIQDKDALLREALGVCRTLMSLPALRSERVSKLIHDIKEELKP